MIKVIFVVQKKPFTSHQRSLDLALSYLKNHLEINYHRWVRSDGEKARIGRTSYQSVVIPGIKDINSAFDRYFPEKKPFQVKREVWRKNKYHKSIFRDESILIEEDEKHFYIIGYKNAGEKNNKKEKEKEEGD